MRPLRDHLPLSRRLLAARRLLPGLVLAAAALLLGQASPAAAQAPIAAIGIENEYADVIAQIGGSAVVARSIISDPNTDPHSFEISPRIAGEIAGAALIVENGLGYDAWADKMIAAAPRRGRIVINVQHLRHLSDATPNPHLWYDPATMPAVAAAIAQALGHLDPAQAAVFAERARAFDASLQPWDAALGALARDFPGAPVAVTEPVGDAMLVAAGARILTPFALEAAIMNDTDPAPQDVSRQNRLLAGRMVRVLLYNQQVTDPLTASFLALARKHGIPVVGLYETMPEPGYHYQSWMLAEAAALRRALAARVSTESLLPPPQPAP
ncbi:metal ABC transporter solute-binding protein, Zn/Mn family [Acidisoma sp. C75]